MEAMPHRPALLTKSRISRISGLFGLPKVDLQKLVDPFRILFQIAYSRAYIRAWSCISEGVSFISLHIKTSDSRHPLLSIAPPNR